MKNIIYLLLLSACTTTQVSQSGNISEIKYTESALVSSPALVQYDMDDSAMSICPNGYRKLNTEKLNSGYMPTYIWKITCLGE